MLKPWLEVKPAFCRRAPQVVEWVLAGVRAEWASPAWQAHLASPEAFIQQYVPVVADGAGGWQVRRDGGVDRLESLPLCADSCLEQKPAVARRADGACTRVKALIVCACLQAGGQAARWILYHQTHLAERCFRTMKAAVPPGSPLHPLAQHAGGPHAEGLAGGGLSSSHSPAPLPCHRNVRLMPIRWQNVEPMGRTAHPCPQSGLCRRCCAPWRASTRSTRPRAGRRWRQSVLRLSWRRRWEG